MGERWQHTYATWLVKTGTAPSSSIVLHTNRGQDVRFTWSSTNPNSGIEYYTPQAGFHVQYLNRNTTTGTFQLRMLTGETIVYNSAGRLTEIWDTLGIPNKVLVTYDAAGQVSAVTDASGKRRLLFAHTSNVLTSVQFQIFVATWTTYHTTSYAYTSGLLTTVTIGGALAQTNVYTSSYLTQVKDAAAKNIVTIAYNATAGKVARLETPQGVLGFEYASTRATCSGKTVLHFNRGNALTCDTDATCGSGYLCGGKTGTGSTGRCFRAARCLTTASPSEDVVTSVAPLGPPGQTCDGACTDVAQYVWNTGTGVLDLKATQDPSGNFTSRILDANGQPTQITTGDSDDIATTGGARTEWRFYGDVNYPAKPTEIRRKSDLATDAASCSGSSTAGCSRTLFTYYSPAETPSGKVKSVTQTGFTPNVDNAPSFFTYTTTMSYDAKGRPTLIDGPLAGSNDVTAFTYWPATGQFSDDFLDTYARKKDATTFLEQRALTYDFWGNPSALKDVDNTMTCLVFDSGRGYLKTRTEAMAGQTDCTANTADLQTKWARDSALRLVQLTRPDGSCMFFEYDANGRLQRTKRRDDCNAASAGDRQEFVYDAEGLLTEVQTYNGASVLTAKQPFTYFDSRRLEKIVNPVDVSKWTGIAYDPRGLVSQLGGAGALGKTVFNRAGTPGAEGRVTSVDKYKTSTTFDTWSLLYTWLGDQLSVADGDAKVTQTTRDDLGREVTLVSPDMTNPVKRSYDAGSRLVQMVERSGAGSDQRTHNFTFDNLGRPLDADYAVGHSAGTCNGTTNPAEIQRVYEAPPVACPAFALCLRTAGRLAYVKTRLMCSNNLGTDWSLDQETFYSYDDAGRVRVEYIQDDAGRVAKQVFTWNKNGDLLDVTTPAGISMGWSYDSATNNSDTDLVSAQSRNGTGNPITTSVVWNPYGPLKQYNQQSTLGGVATRTRISRNLAYRISQVRVETTGGTNLRSVDITEDAKSRVLKRLYTGAAAGVQDSYFVYDDQDRLLCETTSSAAGSCPTSGATIKNSHTLSPPFTNAGDWKRVLRPIPGSTGLTHEFNVNLPGYGTAHRINDVYQSDGVPQLGLTYINYYADGDRSYDNSASQVYGYRGYNYDNRHNLREVTGYYRSGGIWYTYTDTSAFDEKGRRVFKSFVNDTTRVTSTWFYYYDPLDRLTEVRFTPDTAVAATYQLFQLAWLGDRLTGIWQLDFPSVTLTKRYVSTDETNRPLEMWAWPVSGDTTLVWAVNPSAWGFDTNLLGPSVFQPVLFAGQYKDTETAAYLNDGATVHRPGLALNGFRTYDPFTGGYLQVDPLVRETWSTYGYCESDPVNRIDSSGLMVCVIEGGCPDGTFATLGGVVVGRCPSYCKPGCGWFDVPLPGCDCNACGTGGGGGGTEAGDGCPMGCWRDASWECYCPPGTGGGTGWGTGGGGGPGKPTPPPSFCKPWDLFCRLEELIEEWDTFDVAPGSYYGITCTADLYLKQFDDCETCKRGCRRNNGSGPGEGRLACYVQCESGDGVSGQRTACQQCDPCYTTGVPCGRMLGMTQ